MIKSGIALVALGAFILFILKDIVSSVFVLTLGIGAIIMGVKDGIK